MVSKLTGLTRWWLKPRLLRAVAGLLLPVAGDGDQDRVLAALLPPERGRQLVAVHAGEADVQEHHLGPMLAGRGEGLLAVVGDPDLVARELQEPGHPVRRVHVVVDDEHPEASGARSRGSPFPSDGPGPGLGGGEPDDELAPLAGAVARRGDGAAVQLGRATGRA